MSVSSWVAIRLPRRNLLYSLLYTEMEPMTVSCQLTRILSLLTHRPPLSSSVLIRN